MEVQVEEATKEVICPHSVTLAPVIVLYFMLPSEEPHHKMAVVIIEEPATVRPTTHSTEKTQPLVVSPSDALQPMIAPFPTYLLPQVFPFSGPSQSPYPCTEGYKLPTAPVGTLQFFVDPTHGESPIPADALQQFNFRSPHRSWTLSLNLCQAPPPAPGVSCPVEREGPSLTSEIELRFIAPTSAAIAGLTGIGRLPAEGQLEDLEAWLSSLPVELVAPPSAKPLTTIPSVEGTSKIHSHRTVPVCEKAFTNQFLRI